MAEQIRELALALKEEKERHQLEELGFNEAAKKANTDIQGLVYHYRRKAGQIDTIVSKLQGSGSMAGDEAMIQELRNLIIAYKEENDQLRL